MKTIFVTFIHEQSAFAEHLSKLDRASLQALDIILITWVGTFVGSKIPHIWRFGSLFWFLSWDDGKVDIKATASWMNLNIRF